MFNIRLPIIGILVLLVVATVQAETLYRQDGNIALNFDGLERIDTEILPYSDGLYEYANENTIYSAYFSDNPTEGDAIKFVKGSTEITFFPMALNFKNQLSQIEQISIPQAVTGYPSNEFFRYDGVYGAGVNLVYEYRGGQLKEQLILENSSVIPSPAQYILDGGSVQLELGFLINTQDRIFLDGLEWDKKSEMSTNSNVEVRDLSGNLLYYLPPPVAFDSAGAEITGLYWFKKSANDLVTQVHIPYSWLNDSARVWPIYIDPTIVAIDGDNVTLSIQPENSTCWGLYCGSDIIIYNEGDEPITIDLLDVWVDIENVNWSDMHWSDVNGTDYFNNESHNITIPAGSREILAINAMMNDYGVWKYNVTIAYNGANYSIDPYYIAAESEGESTTTANTYQNKATLLITPHQTNPYLIFWDAEATSGSSSSSVYVNAIIDSNESIESLWEAKDSLVARDYPGTGGFVLRTLNTSQHNITLQWRSELAGTTSYIRNAHLSAVEVNGLYFYNETTATQQVGLTWEQKHQLNFTVPEADNYLIIVSGQVRSDVNNLAQTESRFRIDGNIQGYNRYDSKDTSDWVTYTYMRNYTFTAGVHNISIDTQNTKSDADNQVRNLRIFARPTVNSTAFFNYSQQIATTASTTQQQALELNFTAPSAGDYLIFGNARARMDSLSDSYEVTLEIDGTDYCQDLREPTAVDAYFSFLCGKNVTLTAGSHTARIMYRSVYGAGNAYISNGSIVVLPFTAQQCNPQTNQNWVITDAQVCDGVNRDIGTGTIIIQPGGSLELKNNANVTSSSFSIVDRATNLWRILIEHGSRFLLGR